MKKILFKKMSFVFSIIAVLIFAISSVIIFFTESKLAISDLEEMMSEFESAYRNNKNELEESKEFFLDDYMNRTHAVEFMLSNKIGQNLNVSRLEKIQKLMEIESIHVINDTGEVFLSTDEGIMGVDLKDYPEFDPFVKLIDANEPDAKAIQLNAISLQGREPKIYLGVKSTSDEYSVVMIGIKQSTLDRYLEKNSIISIVDAIPTVKEKTLFVVDANSGEIKGITSNNEREVNIEDVDNEKEFLSILKSSQRGKLIEINGTLRLLKTKIVDDKIIGAYVETRGVFNTILLQMVFLGIGVLLVYLNVIRIVKYHLRQYVLNDLASIASTIKEVMDGNYEIEFKTKYDTEFRQITSILNDWKDSYRNKEERITRIFTSLYGHVAVFECLYGINRNFFSDNLQSILGVDDDTWKEIISSPKGLENYLGSLISQSENEIIALKDDKFISIVSYNKENEFYGMIIDKTEDVRLNKEMEQKLHTVKKEAEIDPLTNLINRAGLEKYVNKSLEEQPGAGIMIIFDLDNFKSVNDAMGHPEGDKVLKKFAYCLKSCFRKDDVVARMGGDEFVVFMHSNVDVNVLAEKLQTSLENVRKELSVYYNRFELSTSIGAAYVDSSRNSYEDLYLCADVGLYIAKRLGKDGFFINEENIRCMREKCIQCTEDCKKRKLLGL